jgi:hypothetical protein
MKIIDLIFSKISSEVLKSNKEIKSNLNIKADLKTKDLEKIDIEGQKEKKILKLPFVFNVSYEPSFASINIEGNVVIGADKEEAEDIVKEWKKSKKVGFNIINYLLSKCNVKALQLEDDLKLPYHISLPKLRPKVVEEEK